jgi:hypothetical protein
MADSSDENSHDISAAWSKLVIAAGGRKTRGMSVADRRASEATPVPPTDGRRLRFTGRTSQLNIKVKPDFRVMLYQLAQARDIGMAQMLEIILAEWKRLGGKGEVT